MGNEVNLIWTLIVLTNMVTVKIKTPSAGEYWLLGSVDLESWRVLASGAESTACNVTVKVAKKEREFFAVSWKERKP